MNYRLLTYVLALSLATLLTGCALPGERSGLRTITVLYTNDEHGWMAGMAPGKGLLISMPCGSSRKAITRTARS